MPNILNKPLFLQFFKFSLVGFSNTVIAYAVYFSLVYLGSHYIFANIAAFFISVLNSFFWNNKYVFKNDAEKKRNILQSLVKTYISYAFTGLFLGNVLLFFFIDILQISKYIAPFFGLMITIPLNFILNKKWAFKQIKSDNTV